MIIRLQNYNISSFKYYEEGKVYTDLIKNSCYSRKDDLCVLAIHSTSMGTLIFDNLGRQIKVMTGNYEAILRQREDKLPVLHLNPTSQDPDSVLIHLVMEELHHDESEYSVEKTLNNTIIFEKTTYSSGGKHQSSLLFAILPYNSIIREYTDSYKNRAGDVVSYYKTIPISRSEEKSMFKSNQVGLESLDVNLADGLTLEDLNV